MRNLLLVLLISLSSVLCYGQQDKYIYHEVEAGETVYSISKKYDISKAELEKYNPDVKSGLKEKMLLLIPEKPASRPSKGGERKFTSHKVEQGQTLYSIAQQYEVPVEDIKTVNPELKDGLKAGQTLLIPLLPKKPELPKYLVAGQYKEHSISAGETLYSLALKYGVSVEDIRKMNPDLAEEGLKAGAVLYIPKEASTQKEATDEDKARLAAEVARAKADRQSQRPVGSEQYNQLTSGDYHIHKVEAGQTAYSISKQYHISLDSLYLMNPGTEDGLRLGQLLKLPLNRAKYSNQNLIKNDKPKEELATDTKDDKSGIADTSGGFFLYQVKTGDSYYSLKNRFNVSSEELINLNPELKTGLDVDKYIIIPKKKKEVDTGWLDKVFSDVESSEPLGKPSDDKISQKESLNGNKPAIKDTSAKRPVSPKNLAMDRPIHVGVMLPFMAGTDTSFNYDLEVPAKSHYVLDFYNGLLLAADTLAKQGMNLSIKVYDTQNSLFTLREKINDVKQSDYDMVIGPLFQKNVEYVADQLKSKGTPVISPLSRTVDLGNRPNLVKCVPSSEAGAQEIADLLNSNYREAKIIFAHSNSMEDREKIRQIKARLTPRMQNNFIENVVSEENLIKRVSLTDAMSADKPNVVVVFSEDKVFLSDLVAKLRTMRSMQVSLVAPSKVMQIPTLEMDYLNTLKLTMTDASFVDYTNRATIRFIKEYRKRYGAEPSQMAFQGYDVAYYFLNQLWYNGSYVLEQTGTKTMLSTGFRLTRIGSGGYENQFVHITGIRNFTLVKLSVAAEPKTTTQNVEVD